MVSRQQIEEANYKQYDNDVEEIGQCCSEPCDHLQTINDNGQINYYCEKLGIFVHPYDSCKYHSTLNPLLEKYAKILIQEEKQRKRRLVALIIVGLYLFIVFICNLIYG